MMALSQSLNDYNENNRRKQENKEKWSSQSRLREAVSIAKNIWYLTAEELVRLINVLGSDETKVELLISIQGETIEQAVVRSWL